jgi:hypothetical protein
MPKPPPLPEKTLEERIADHRAELDAFMDAKALEVKKECPGVPLEVVRGILTKHFSCQCQAVLTILEQT